MLESIGLDTREHEVYRALLTWPDWDMKAVQRHLGLTEDQVRSALDRLAELSLLHAGPGGDRLVPVHPELSIAPRLQRVEAELDEQRARLSRDRAALATLAADFASLRHQSGGEGVERLTGAEAVRGRLQELAHQATSEIRSLIPGGSQSAEALNASRRRDEQTLTRGVHMQTIHVDSVRNNRATVDYATWFASRGGHTRTHPSLPMRLILCDRSVAVVPLNLESTAQGAFVIHLKGVVLALNELFDLLWARSTPLGERQTPDPDGPSERDLAMLRMLQDGLTDEGISRKLGVSLRTVRRLMADLMRRLNAQSRFQVGAEAVRRNWI